MEKKVCVCSVCVEMYKVMGQLHGTAEKVKMYLQETCVCMNRMYLYKPSVCVSKQACVQVAEIVLCVMVVGV